jgi:hypothetical protein
MSAHPSSHFSPPLADDLTAPAAEDAQDSPAGINDTNIQARRIEQRGGDEQ